MSDTSTPATARPQDDAGTQIRQRKVFVNLAVGDLKKSMDFFSKLGFTFNPKE